MDEIRQDGLRRKAGEITRRLDHEYGTPHLGNFRDPIKELVYISLTRQTHGPNARASWERVVAAGGPRALLRMPVRQIATMIKAGGFSRQKAAWISESLRRIQSQMGALSLAKLKKWNDERAELFLHSLPGVGIKTARCIMMYSLKRKVLPVDVHVRRLATRIGLVPDGLSEKRIHAELDKLIAPRYRFSFHVNSICHGRHVCRAVRPKCRECIILESCKYGRVAVRSEVGSSYLGSVA